MPRRRKKHSSLQARRGQFVEDKWQQHKKRDKARRDMKAKHNDVKSPYHKQPKNLLRNRAAKKGRPIKSTKASRRIGSKNKRNQRK